MPHGINAAVAATVPICAKAVSPAVYFMAVRCQSYEEAYNKWLRKIEHLLPIPLVKPWKRVEKDQHRTPVTTSQYSQGNTALVDHDHRATEPSRSVAAFSEGASRASPIMGKVSPSSSGIRRIPKECVCQGCGRDMRRGWIEVHGRLVQAINHDKCMDQRTDTSVLGPKAGMSRKTR